MDIALEIVDSYVFDYIYSAVLPVQPRPYDLKDGLANSSTYDYAAASPWRFEPSNALFQLQPSEAAYTSQWTRDNIYRQAISLFFITWYAP